MPDTNDKIKALYDAASQKFDIGTEQEFRQKLTDPTKRKAFYDAASADFDLGTYDEYEKKLGPTQKQIDEGKAIAAKVPSFKDFAAQRGVYVPKVGEIQVTSDIAERLPSLSRKAEIAKDVQEAPERIKLREERKEKAKADALKNNTIKALTASGTKFTEGDAVYKKMQENIKSVVEKGAMTLSADAAGNPVYKRSAGIIESFINNFEASRKDIKDSEVFRKSSDAESVKIAEEIIKGIKQEAVPSGAAAEISGMFGSAAPLLGRAVIGGGAAAKFLPGPAKIITALGSFGATISPSYDQAYKQGAVELYAKGIDEMKRQKRLKGESDELSQQEKEEAMRMAKNEASVSGFAEGIFTAGLSSIPLGSSVAGQSFKKAMVNFAKNTAKEVPRNVTLGAASEIIKDVSARNAGYNITTAETLNSVLERSGQDAITTLAFEVGLNLGDVANVPKYVKAAANNYLSTIPSLEFNNFAKELEGRGVVEQGFAEKSAASLAKFNESKSRVPSFIPEADMPSFAGLIEKKTNLENQKKSTDPAFHAKIDEQIAAVDARIKKMQESPNPIFDEVDELTGDTGDATPITEAEIEKSIEYADGFIPETTEAKMADGEKELFSETDSKGRAYTFFSNTKEKDGKITTTFSFNRSDKGPSQRNNSTLGIPVEKALGDKYTIDEDYIPEGAKVVGVSEIRITEEGSAATVTLENEGQRYQEEVKLKSNTTYDAELKALKQPSAEPMKEVERLRAEEQKELESAIPNIEEYKVDGVVDRTKITNEEELAKFDEIYNKYDKLITPLLETQKVAKAPVFKIDGAEKFFHASPNKITGPLKKSTAKGFGTGIYFSTNKDIVKSEFGENVTEVSLNIENPVYTNTMEWIDVQSLAIKLADADYGKKKGLTLEEGETFHRYDSENLSEIDEIPSEFISKAAQELGHDAIVDKGSAAYDNEVLVLDESKIQYKEPVVKETLLESPFKPVEGFEGFEVTTKEGKKERYANPDKVLASSTIRMKNRAEQDAIIDAIGEPRDARQVAMIALMGKPNISYESYVKETGFGQGEVKTRRGRQTEVAASPFTRKEGNTVEGVAEFWWDNLPEELRDRMDSQDIRNEIIDLLSTYKDQNEIREAYIEAYSPKEISDEEAMNFFSRYAEEINPIEKELDDWAMERGEKEMALELDENYVDKLIEQYESTKEIAEPAGGKKEGVVEEAGGTYAAKEKGVIEGGDVKKYIDEQATPEESTDFDGFAKRELAREDFDAEYKSARVEGETKEQYLIRKYCK
ncbi:MAG: hypothetical protein ACRCW1_01720 [Anaerotignaceae bacterium]